MCGFLVGCGTGIDPAQMGELVDCLTHRGPDEEGTFANRAHNLSMAHRRLNIIDPEGGQQPMTRDGSTIVYNGEIYNYRELREELRSGGRSFQTDSDTEVVLQAYNKWGKACLERLRGMFAFGIWDGADECLFLARDRLGQKPLLYSTASGAFAAASEMQALVDLPTVSRKMNLNAIHTYLQLKYVPSPESGFEDVQKLEPGYYLVVKQREVVEKTRYWSPSTEKKEDVDLQTYREDVRDTLREAVRLRLRSDVTLGAFLSGGIDSSIVVALMAQESENKIRTFSVGFEHDEYNELPYARSVAERYDTDHTELVAEPDVQNLLPQLARHYGEPFADASAVPTYYVSKKTSQHVKVALTGDGGDEIFGGYRRYEGMMLHQFFSRWFPEGILSLMKTIGQYLPRTSQDSSLINKGRRLLNGLTGSPAEKQMSFLSHFHSDSIDQLLKTEVNEVRKGKEYMQSFYKRFSALDSLAEQTMLVDLMTQLPDQLNVKVDIASMMNSIECRSPFLDHELVDVMTRVPLEQRIRWGQKKRILKSAFKEDLPEDVLSHKKQGFSIPRAEWMRGELSDFMKDRLLHGTDTFQELVRIRPVKRMIKQHLSHHHDWSKHLWSLLMFELWTREYDVRL